jgi:hypothetical protein
VNCASDEPINRATLTMIPITARMVIAIASPWRTPLVSSQRVNGIETITIKRAARIGFRTVATARIPAMMITIQAKLSRN